MSHDSGSASHQPSPASAAGAGDSAACGHSATPAQESQTLQTPSQSTDAVDVAGEAAPAKSVRWWGMTDKGRFRANNEDAFLCVTLDSEQVYRLGKIGEGDFSGGDFVFAVSDGMGGAKAGEFASSIAIDKITRLFPASYRQAVRGGRRGALELLGELFVQIHEGMTSMGFYYEECRGMGATLSLGWFTPGCLFFGHVGDSRIYHLPAGETMRQVSEDHTHVAWLLRHGKITSVQARTHPARGQLEMVLGGNVRNIHPQVGMVHYQPGDRFLFCSDGINGGISDRVIEDLILNPSERTAQWTPAERLIREAAYGSRDNMTAILVETV